MRTFDSYLTEIMDEFTSKAYEAELKKAKQEFFETTGPVHEDDAFYETYMTAFIEWYLFDRDLKNQDLPPVRLFYRNHLKQLSEEDQKVFNDFTKFRHSLFLVKKVSDTVTLENLFDGEKIKIESYIPAAAFTKNEIFEAILVPYKNEWAFTKMFFVHPAECQKFIQKEMKKIRGLEYKILLKTLSQFRRLRLKLDRYPYVAPTQIYCLEEFQKHAEKK